MLACSLKKDIFEKFVEKSRKITAIESFCSVAAHVIPTTLYNKTLHHRWFLGVF